MEGLCEFVIYNQSYYRFTVINSIPNTNSRLASTANTHIGVAEFSYKSVFEAFSNFHKTLDIACSNSIESV
mgnify:CR=1 FL=1